MAIELIDTVRPKNEQPFPIVLSNDVKGGIHYAEDYRIMEAIPKKRRQAGMLCYVKSDQFYKLEDDLTTWTPLGNLNGSVSGASVHIGKEPPSNTSIIWIDSSTPCTLTPSSYGSRIKNNYANMLNKLYTKLLYTESDLGELEVKINEISADNANKVGEFRVRLAQTRDGLDLLRTRILDTMSVLATNEDIGSIKIDSKQIRKDVKSLLYSIVDFADGVMRLLDSENGIVIPDGGGDSGSKPSEGDEVNALLTEVGLNILAEDGSSIIADIMSTPSDLILTELGQTILTEDDRQILKG